MPKAQRIRHTTHLSSVKLKQKTGADSEFLDEPPLLPTVQLESPVTLPVVGLPVQLTKKEKTLERRESFLRKLGPALPTFSKSHERRMKRKAREQLAGETLADLSFALASVEAASTTDTDVQDPGSAPKHRSPQKPGVIGEGKPQSLSTVQRKRVFELERLRHPLILQNSQFSANPFKTIRTHAQNTLVKHTAT